MIVMPDSMSVERIKMMEALGAEVILTEGAKGLAGAIEKANEQALYAQLLKWVKECCPFQHTKEEIETYALELHTSRIFDNPQWAAYEEFNRKYRI